MIAYLDTSAIIPLLVAEPTTDLCRRVWDEADILVSSRLAYVEVAAALAQAERQQRVSSGEYDAAWASFTTMWSALDVVEATPELSVSAASLARSAGLRGYDAVHCASALALADADTVAVAGDARLLTAWREAGAAVIDTHHHA